VKYCPTPVRVALLALIAVTGCGYGEVSPKTYEYTQALYSITNRQSSDKLAEFESKLEKAKTAQELNDSEFNLLSDIVATAKSGDWKSAQGDCRELMEAQVGLRKN
jgi:chromosome condensin MukBEF ATPase and DNA-binding subunit MukB